MTAYGLYVLLPDAAPARGTRSRGKPRLMGAHVPHDVRRPDRLRAGLRPVTRRRHGRVPCPAGILGGSTPANKKRNNETGRFPWTEAPLLFRPRSAPADHARRRAAWSKRAAPRRSPRPSGAPTQARYQEIRCRSALNRVKGMPFNWTLNPYRGCTHGCHYCFARSYQAQLEMGAGDEFASVIFVKTNFVDVLRSELDDPHWTREQAALGTATDPYQPIEGHYKLTRGTLQALAAGKTPVGIVTKGPMVVRDIDVLQDLAQRRRRHRVPQRADGRRVRVADAGARHRASIAAPARGESARRRRHRRRRADGSARAWFLDRAREDRSHRQGHRRSRGALRRLKPRCSSKAAPAITSCGSCSSSFRRSSSNTTGCTPPSTRRSDYRERVQKTVRHVESALRRRERKAEGRDNNPPKEPASACIAERQSSQGELRWS